MLLLRGPAAADRSAIRLVSHSLLQAAYSLSTLSKVPSGGSEQQPRAAGRGKRHHNSRQSADQQQQQKQQHPVPQEPDQQCRLIVAVVGLPNAGKSTLTNRLIGHKISGVSSKRNTTIDPQLGSFTVGSSQVRCSNWTDELAPDMSHSNSSRLLLAPAVCMSC